MKILLAFACIALASTTQAQQVYELEKPETFTATHVKMKLLEMGDSTSLVEYTYCDSLGNPLKGMLRGQGTILNEKMGALTLKTPTKTQLNEAYAPLGITVKRKRLRSETLTITK